MFGSELLLQGLHEAWRPVCYQQGLKPLFCCQHVACNAQVRILVHFKCQGLSQSVLLHDMARQR